MGVVVEEIPVVVGKIVAPEFAVVAACSPLLALQTSWIPVHLFLSEVDCPPLGAFS